MTDKLQKVIGISLALVVALSTIGLTSHISTNSTALEYYLSNVS